MNACQYYVFTRLFFVNLKIHLQQIKGIKFKGSNIKKKVKVKKPLYRPGVAQGVSRGITLLFQDLGTRRGCVVSSTPPPVTLRISQN
jgi:hypothetical protein